MYALYVYLLFNFVCTISCCFSQITFYTVTLRDSCKSRWRYRISRLNARRCEPAGKRGTNLYRARELGRPKLTLTAGYAL